MSRLLLLIGLPGSGKSTLAAHLLQQGARRLISTDRIRADLFGDESVQGPWLTVWAEVGRQFRQAVLESQAGIIREAIYDATNAVRKQRRQTIALARESGFTHITGLWLNVPLWLCLQRNQQRDRQVPEEVILHMSRSLCDAPPSEAEDFDRLLEITPEFRPFHQ
jgi:predicted kinase